LPIVDNPAEHRFELQQDGERAELVYERTPERLTIIHTEVPASMQGGGVGGQLVRAAVAEARRAGLQLVVRCPFAREYLKKHPDLMAG
jgi:predicted GNAT family acetyltransferase